MKISKADREILRGLAREVAKIAALNVHKEKAELWRKVNDLRSERPVVGIREMPWHEMNVDDEMTLLVPKTEKWAHAMEWLLRTTIYQWKHMAGDMVVPDYLGCPVVIESTGIGLNKDMDVVVTDPKSGIISRGFHPQFIEPEDVEKIKMPVVTYNEKETEETFAVMTDLFADIMPVKKVAWKGRAFNPWDELVQYWGVTEALMDLVVRPEMVHEAMRRMVAAGIHQLDEIEKLNMYALNNDHWHVGSGGYGYTSELPGKDYDPARVRPNNMWGFATAQIFAAVSPEMHWEFALQHEMKWLERWGLNAYGCCEALDGKMDLMRKIPRLRKVSMSPWINVDRAVREVRDDYVFSFKPNPAILAEDRWRPEAARATIREVLEKGKGCHIEIIMKDISTVRYEPRRLWEWARIAMEEVGA